jgi:hypothetical protein
MTLLQLAELFAMGGVVMTLLASVMTGAYVAGKHSNRITNLERLFEDVAEEAKTARAEASAAAAQLAGHGATLKALDDTVTRGFDDLKKAIRDLTPRPTRRSGGGE